MALSLNLLPRMARAVPDESCGTHSGLCWPRLKPGTKGATVETFQRLMNLSGFKLRVSGTFDSNTVRATKSYQSRHKLFVDGLVGFQTWESIVPTLRRGSQGQSVKVLQGLLWTTDHATTRDGIYGRATEQHVKDFQKDIALTQVNGIADETVWCFLLHGHMDGE